MSATTRKPSLRPARLGFFAFILLGLVLPLAAEPDAQEQPATQEKPAEVAEEATPAAACGECPCGNAGDRLAIGLPGIGGGVLFFPPPIVPPPPIGVVLACGAVGQSCCDFGGCNIGLVCGPTGRCMQPVACGMAGQQCCPGALPCSAGLECTAGSICRRPCGAAGQACCGQGTPCDAGLTCNNGTCRRPCGSAGQACCVGQSCDPGLACNDQGTCRRCGEIGDICCPGNSCNSGKACNPGTRRCEACGMAPGQLCCPTGCLGENANTNLFCNLTSSPPRCNTCGVTGAVCCPQAPQCQPGSTCRGGVCS